MVVWQAPVTFMVPNKRYFLIKRNDRKTLKQFDCLTINNQNKERLVLHAKSYPHLL